MYTHIYVVCEGVFVFEGLCAVSYLNRFAGRPNLGVISLHSLFSHFFLSVAVQYTASFELFLPKIETTKIYNESVSFIALTGIKKDQVCPPTQGWRLVNSVCCPPKENITQLCPTNEFFPKAVLMKEESGI